MGYLAHTVAMEEINRASAGIGLSYGAHNNLCVNQLMKTAMMLSEKSTCPNSLTASTLAATSEPNGL